VVFTGGSGNVFETTGAVLVPTGDLAPPLFTGIGLAVIAVLCLISAKSSFIVVMTGDAAGIVFGAGGDANGFGAGLGGIVLGATAGFGGNITFGGTLTGKFSAAGLRAGSDGTGGPAPNDLLLVPDLGFGITSI